LLDRGTVTRAAKTHFEQVPLKIVKQIQRANRKRGSLKNPVRLRRKA
jgi:hypothetical protein